jgi:uncharacterized protein (TIGR03437 family)
LEGGHEGSVAGIKGRAYREVAISCILIDLIRRRKLIAAFRCAFYLTGTTGVTVNGVQANFAVKSDTYIKATVPAGATTGTVSVVTPSGTLNSNPQFIVTK